MDMAHEIEILAHKIISWFLRYFTGIAGGTCFISEALLCSK
jgi:hypothetical protein